GQCAIPAELLAPAAELEAPPVPDDRVEAAELSAPAELPVRARLGSNSVVPAVSADVRAPEAALVAVVDRCVVAPVPSAAAKVVVRGYRGQDVPALVAESPKAWIVDLVMEQMAVAVLSPERLPAFPESCAGVPLVVRHAVRLSSEASFAAPLGLHAVRADFLAEMFAVGHRR